MKLVIVKYNAGNIQSVLYALERIGMEAVVTDDHQQIKEADKVIFPGVGEASSAMGYLQERGLDTVIKNLQQPVLGICLGMQLMCAFSEENNTNCLGIFNEQVKWFKNIHPKVPSQSSTSSVLPQSKIPQIGWNNIYHIQTPLFTLSATIAHPVAGSSAVCRSSSQNILQECFCSDFNIFCLLQHFNIRCSYNSPICIFTGRFKRFLILDTKSNQYRIF